MPRYEELSDAEKFRLDYFKITANDFNRIAANLPATVSAGATIAYISRLQSYHSPCTRWYPSEIEFKILAGEIDAEFKITLQNMTATLSDSDQAALVCFAALCGNVAALKLIINKYPRSIVNSLHQNMNIAHAAAIATDYSALIYVLYTYPELCDLGARIKTYPFNNRISYLKDLAQVRYYKALSGVLALKHRDRILNNETGWEKLFIELKKLRDSEETHIPFAKEAYRACVDFHIPRLQRLLKSSEHNAALQTLIYLKTNGIEEAAEHVNTYLGAAALAQGQLIKDQYKASDSGFFASISRNMQLSKMCKHFEEADKYGNANANFQMGECFHKGIYVAQDLEKAFAYYFSAAKRGDAQAKAVLTISENDDSKNRDQNLKTLALIDSFLASSNNPYLKVQAALNDPVRIQHEMFLKLVYQGLLINNQALLQKAASMYPDKINKFALDNISNLKHDRTHRVLLLKTAMTEKRSDAQLNNALFDLIGVEINKAINTTNKLQFLLDAKAILTPVHFSEVCILLLDSMKLKDATSRMAVLKVLSSMAASTEMQQVITAHLKTIDMKVQTECVRAFAEVIVKRESDPVMVHVIESASSSSSTSSSSSSAVQSVEDVAPDTLPTYPATVVPLPVYQNAAPNTVLFSTPVPPAEPAPQIAAADVNELPIFLPDAPQYNLEEPQEQKPVKKQEERVLAPAQ